VQLVEQVGPQLPKFFSAITDVIVALLPYLPTLIGFVRDFVSALTWFIQAGGTVIGWFHTFFDAWASSPTTCPEHSPASGKRSSPSSGTWPMTP
jgi:hypothetical protein